MSFDRNRVIIACAGSGKTTRIVTEALDATQRRIAIITYTNNNVREIINRFGELNSGVPHHVEVMTWFNFLTRECGRPYQRTKCPSRRIEGLCFVNHQSARLVPESRVQQHYFASDGRIYSDKLSKFIVQCEKASGGLVTERLQERFSDVFIDEFQDLAGWDLDWIHTLLQSRLRVTLVGDPRQHIYSTNPASKNKQYLGIDILKLTQKWQAAGLCAITDPMNGSHRCHQSICDFVNCLWPGMDPMKSLSKASGDVTGVFCVDSQRVDTYIGRCRPQVLRYNKNAASYGCLALNFGVAKGLQFEHVLVVPTEPVRKYLRTGDLSHVIKSRDKLHVAVTRARRSVGFAFDGESPVVPNRFV